jgi:signal transduction histidine kinase
MCQGAATVAADGTILYCNRHFAQVLRSPLESTIGASIYEFVTAEQEGEFRALLWGALARSCEGTPFSLHCRDGGHVSSVITATPLSVGGMASICLILTDLTQYEALLAAEEASRLKDEFLATVSHELRTPLSSILLWAKLLETGSISESDRRRAITAIISAAEAQHKLIEDLLDVSRMIFGKLRLNRTRLELDRVVQTAVDAVRPQAIAKQVQLESLSTETGICVLGDPDRLQQIFWNLLSNAVKFTPSGGCVQVRFERAGTTARIVVQDSGKGIPRDFLPFVFDRFRQADPASARTHGGLGLGLNIVRELVELHGGSVQVESDGEGHGATFSVEIPLAE